MSKIYSTTQRQESLKNGVDKLKVVKSNIIQG